jgi:hypothetical protein
MSKRELQTTADITLRSPKNQNSNRLLREIEHDIDTYRDMAALGKVAEIQKDHYEPLKHTARQLIALGNHGRPMYKRSQVS